MNPYVSETIKTRMHIISLEDSLKDGTSDKEIELLKSKINNYKVLLTNTYTKEEIDILINIKSSQYLNIWQLAIQRSEDFYKKPVSINVKKNL